MSGICDGCRKFAKIFLSMNYNNYYAKFIIVISAFMGADSDYFANLTIWFQSELLFFSKIEVFMHLKHASEVHNES